MSLYVNSHRLAILGGTPAFPPGKPVPQIYPSGFGHAGEDSSVDAILANKSSPGSVKLANRQRFVSKALAGAGLSYRSILERRLAEYLALNAGTTSVICVSKGTNALRAALKTLLVDNDLTARNEVIMPAITVASTAEAVIMEGYTPVITDVDTHSWMLSPEATAQSISKKTAAIITVDWLGTHCDLGPFREMADKHSLKLISDSAQSFGALPGKPPAVDLADAVIYSTGSPKVFHTGGLGGILICSKSRADWLEAEPTGILRHEVMSETNAYQGLRALDELPEALETRIKAAEIYRQLLGDTPGITFQRTPPGLGANHYQLSMVVDRTKFGLDAKTLCEALRAENILCSAERVVSLGSMHRLQQSCKVAGDLRISRELGKNSATLPLFNYMTPELCRKICSYVNTIHEQSATIASRRSLNIALPLLPSEQADVIDLASKFCKCSVLRILDEREFVSRSDGNFPSTVLVPTKYLFKRGISIDELHRVCLSKQQWALGDEVIDGLIVDSKNGATVFLSPCSEGDTQIANKSVSLDESGSSADVALVLGHNGELEVHKTSSKSGIDGNGRPWLQRQMRFLANSVAVSKTNLFVKPLRFKDEEDTTSITFPYVASHSLAEMAFAGMPAASMLTVLSDLLGEMATSVWSEGNCDAPANFIEQAHFSRMERRVAIARSEVPQLDEVASYESITLNGRQLLGFGPVLQALRRHPLIAATSPRKLSEIHGDLNIHNILCQLHPDADRPVVLIDPRGVPLLDDSASPRGFEAGDYCYDLSKLKFSLSGFAEIRKGMFCLSGEGPSFELAIKTHPGSDTMVGADRGLFAALSSNESFMQWVCAVERSGFKSMELRTLLGEAAHFVADSACALGRDKKEEVLPLFLLGLEKLNDVLKRVLGEGDCSIDKLKAATESPNYGVAMIQSTLLKLGSLDTCWPWDVLEVLVKSESTTAAQQLLSELVGEYLPDGTDVHVSTHPVESVSFPCMLIHPFDGVRGQTHAVLSAVRRTSAFFRDAGVSQETVDGLRTVTVSSTGASIHSQYTTRQNDKLLAPGSWGISPLKLSVLQANQAVFPQPGRWIVENDSFFLLSRTLKVGGDGLCLLTSKGPTTGSDSSWRVCIDSMERINGQTFVTGFRDICPNEKETKLLRTTSAIFIPNHLAQSLNRKETDYATRTSSILIDFVLPRFMPERDWISLCHKSGFGINSDLAWINAQQIACLSPKVELMHGGDEMKSYRFGSDSEYTKLIDGITSDPMLNSLAYLPTMAKWHRCRVGLESGTC
ncbi:hypothetical protein IW262DRAFT_401294 [Armillaria fumosa]|nr:hypothetical protein IW262DRAFT_401294 [Armillaria fumosa]